MKNHTERGADSPRLSCPSSRCESGATLLGVILPDGKVAFARDRIVVNEEFVQIARQGRSPERRFRFSGPCLEKGCQQWRGDHCGVIGQVLESAPTDEPAAPLPECSIRPTCRWFAQEAERACRVCPLVITDARQEL